VPGSHASLLVPPATGKEYQMSDGYGMTSGTASAFFDPDTSSWKMSQGCFQWDDELVAAAMWLQRLPAWGTTAGGALFEHQTPGHLTAARDGSASLATPTAWLGRRPSQAVGDAERWYDPERSNELSDQMAALLPTPVVNDMGRGKTVEDWDSWTDAMKERHGNGNGHGASLAIEVLRLLPTPMAGDSKTWGPGINWKERAKHNHSPLPSVLMNLLSDDGNASSGDRSQPQQTIEDSDPSSSNG
jgi:hypothetical protein